jgi:hypothetical protein
MFKNGKLNFVGLLLSNSTQGLTKLTRVQCFIVSKYLYLIML